MQRILVIRGGAIGDFVLTLPAIRALRERFATAHVEILGHKQIIALADHRFYADVTRSIDDAALARLFTPESELPKAVVDYFEGFDLVLSFLSDPDKTFEQNIKRCGVRNYIAAVPRALDSDKRHAAAQLARALRVIGVTVTDFSAQLYPSEEDRVVAQSYVAELPGPIAAIHPGSGRPTKNWPVAKWSTLGSALLDSRCISSIITVTGEADRDQLAYLQDCWRGKSVRYATHLPLPHLAAIIERCSLFLGHDSGISHIAAAVGTPSVLLFGPTNPKIWAPQSKNVTVLTSSTEKIEDLSEEQVFDAVRCWLATN
ncbi:MAG: glycosyltransferase family 9 protein [Chthoniobacterales bacterium]